MCINIAIDGPAGSGKSTISKEVAKKLEFIYVDTGALYRTVGLKLLNLNCTADNEEEVSNILKNTTVELKYINGEQKVFLDSEDVADKIRTPQASMMASKCSALPIVRSYLLDMQRDIAKNNSIIMDGRDIGTVVLPFADVKIFLTASSKARAERRYKELIEKGINVEFNDVLSDIEKRDYNDSNRNIAPLKPSEDSVFVDTSELSLEESIQLVYDIVIKYINSQIKE